MNAGRPPRPDRWAKAADAPGELLVVGGASLDVLVVRGEPVPSAGGAGLYTALAAARAGLRVTMLAPRPDPIPPPLEPALGLIHWVGPTVAPEDLPRFEIAYDEDGHVTEFREHLGAEPSMTTALLDRVGPLPAWAYCVPFLDARLQHDFVVALADRGCLTVAGTYARAVRTDTGVVRRTLATADVFCCNEDEATVLFGSPEAATTTPGRLLYVTRGPAGVRVLQGDHATDVAGVTVDALDPTGAGDTFCGTVTAGLVVGRHPVEAARFANAAAADQVQGVGPARLLAPGEPPRPPEDPRVVVDEARVGALAARIAELPALDAFGFTGDLFPPAGEAGAAAWFLAATLQQFGFWYDADGRYATPMVRPIDGVERKGSDYLWAAYRRWAVADPAGLTTAGHAGLDTSTFDTRLADDTGTQPLPDPATAHALAVAYGSTMVELGLDPDELVALAASAGRPMDALLRLLDHVGGYREDPLRKKSALLGVVLRQRPEAWLPEPASGDDDAPPIVDYHVQRTALRTGMVVVRDGALRSRLVERTLLPEADEASIRGSVRDAVAGLVAGSGRSMGVVDWFLFQMRHRCPETSAPRCGECPAEPACARRVDLFQPVRRTSFY